MATSTKNERGGKRGASAASKRYNTAINSQVESVPIPTLSGSPKQQQWASSIMQGIMDDIDIDHDRMKAKSRLQEQIAIAQETGQSPKTTFGDTLVDQINDDRGGSYFFKQSFAEFCRGRTAGEIIALRFAFKDMLKTMNAKKEFVSAFKKSGGQLTPKEGAKATGRMLRQMGENW